jgi:hypothetical protein
VKAGQALISAIAIATRNPNVEPALPPDPIATGLNIAGKPEEFHSWMDTGADFASLPANLFGAEWAVANRAAKVSFQLKADADVYLATSIPQEFPGFENTGTFIKNNKGDRFAVYKKRFRKGSELAAVTNSASIIALNAVSSLAPAFDLKTAVNYPAVATLASSKGVEKISLMGKERIQFVQNNDAVIEFTIGVGVADTYSLTLKYHNPTAKVLQAKIEVLALDGTVMKKAEIIKLAQTKPGKWSYITTSTGTMINAGQYKVRILSVDTRDVSVDGLEVQ